MSEQKVYLHFPFLTNSDIVYHVKRRKDEKTVEVINDYLKKSSNTLDASAEISSTPKKENQDNFITEKEKLIPREDNQIIGEPYNNAAKRLATEELEKETNRELRYLWDISVNDLHKFDILFNNYHDPGLIADLFKLTAEVQKPTNFDNLNGGDAVKGQDYETKAAKVLEDWNSKPLEKEGVKHSENKLPMEIDFNFIKQMAEKMQANKKNGKYEPFNWKKQIEVRSLAEACMRHCIEIIEGNYEDDGREFGHLEAIANNAMMINYQLNNYK